jgi:hypothetical protein
MDAAALAAAGLSLQQLALLCKSGGITQAVSSSHLTPLRCIAKMLYGSDFDADAVQVPELLQHWDEFEQQVRRQVAGTHPTLPSLTAGTVRDYTSRVLVLLDEPVVQAHLSPRALLQLLQHKVEALKAELVAVVRGEQAANFISFEALEPEAGMHVPVLGVRVYTG